MNLAWFDVFFKEYNGVIFSDTFQPNFLVALDTSLLGLWVVSDTMVYGLPVPPEFNNYTIAHLEVLNTVVARTFGLIIGKIRK